MNSTLLVHGIVITTSLCIWQYFYRPQYKKYNNDLLLTECKNISKMLKFFQKERRYYMYTPRSNYVSKWKFTK